MAGAPDGGYACWESINVRLSAYGTDDSLANRRIIAEALDERLKRNLGFRVNCRLPGNHARPDLKR